MRASADEFDVTTTSTLAVGGNPGNRTRSVFCHLTSTGCAHIVTTPVTTVWPPETASTVVLLPLAKVERHAVDMMALSMPSDVVSVYKPKSSNPLVIGISD